MRHTEEVRRQQGDTARLAHRSRLSSMANGNKQARPRGAHLRGGCCSQRKAWRRAKRARAKAPPRSIGVIYCSPGKAVKKRSAQSLRAAVHLLPAVFTVTSPRSSSPPFNRRRSYATAGRKKHLAASLSMQAREPPARCDPLVRCTEAPRIKREQLSALTLRRITPEYHYANPGLVVSPRPTHQDSWLISEGTLRGASEEARDEDPTIFEKLSVRHAISATTSIGRGCI